jgi:hypothetical protein
MIGSGAGTVPEVEHPEWSGTTSYSTGTKVMVTAARGVFTALESVNRTYVGVCVSPVTGNVYASVYGGSIWMQTGGSGAFADLSAGTKNWGGMAAAPNGDIYAIVYGGSIWKQTAGAGAFADISAGSKNWNGITVAPNGDVYASVYAASIWILAGGVGSFADLGAVAGNKDWYQMAASSTGDIYAVVTAGSIWKRTGGGGNFADISAGSEIWRGIAVDQQGTIYASVGGGKIWRSYEGAAFAEFSTTTSNWNGVACHPTNGNIYAVSESADGYIRVSTWGVAHKVYESLVGSNLGNYPISDVLATTPKWLEYSATNKWKPFDGKVNSQMATPSPAVYVITPGVAFDSVALFNLVATSVTIATDSPAYSQTVSTGATDIVKMDLAGGAASVLTITITNTAGAAKCGEIVVGNKYSLGTMQPLPTVGITDYSTKEADVFGDWNIVPRESSEKMSCVISVPYSSLDAVIAKLKSYRTTPIVFIGSASYACTIIYGFIKDWSVPVATRGKSILALEIDGLT